MFEARLPVDVPIAEDLRKFIQQYFETGGPQECEIQDIIEYALCWSRTDLLTPLGAIRAEYGNLWLRREFWV